MVDRVSCVGVYTVLVGVGGVLLFLLSRRRETHHLPVQGRMGARHRLVVRSRSFLCHWPRQEGTQRNPHGKERDQTPTGGSGDRRGFSWYSQIFLFFVKITVWLAGGAQALRHWLSLRTFRHSEMIRRYMSASRSSFLVMNSYRCWLIMSEVIYIEYIMAHIYDT